MILNADALAVIAIFLASQTGALIYFAGMVSVNLRSLLKWRDLREQKCEVCNRVVIQLATKGGIEL